MLGGKYVLEGKVSMKLYIRPAQIFFGISASNSTVKFGPKPAWRPIFSQFRSRLTTSRRLRRSPGRGSMSPIWGPSEPPWRGQTTSELVENWSPGRFWPKLHHGVWGGNPKKIWAALFHIYIGINFNRQWRRVEYVPIFAQCPGKPKNYMTRK